MCMSRHCALGRVAQRTIQDGDDRGQIWLCDRQLPVPLTALSGSGSHELPAITRACALADGLSQMLESKVQVLREERSGPKGAPMVLSHSRSRELRAITCKRILLQLSYPAALEENLGFALGDGLGRRALS